jgi:Protein of unknown function (DUF992)
MRFFLATFTIVAVCWASGHDARATAPVPGKNLGTLTCTLAPGTKEPFGVERKLSCVFEPILGAKASFVGVVKRLGVEAPDRKKVVLVWSVIGPDMNTPPSRLEGRYVGNLPNSDGQQTAPNLVGGADSKIALQPLTTDANLGSNAALSVLELDLAAMRA